MPPMKSIEEAIDLEHSRRRDSNLANLAAAHLNADEGIKAAQADIARLTELKAKIVEEGKKDDIDETAVARLYKESRDVTFSTHGIIGGRDPRGKSVS